MHEGLTQYETGIEVNFSHGSSSQVILDPTDGKIGAEICAGEVLVKYRVF